MNWIISGILFVMALAVLVAIGMCFGSRSAGKPEPEERDPIEG